MKLLYSKPEFEISMIYFLVERKVAIESSRADMKVEW